MAAIAAVVCPPRFSPERDMPDQSGRIALVTGGNSGVGYETVKQLLLKNATVYLAARSDERAPAAIAKLQTETDGKKAIFLKLDLGDIPSVRRAAEDFLAKEERLDYLFNNGCYELPSRDVDGVQFGTNVIGHFFLTELLMPALLKSIVTTGVPARIIHTSSIGHNMVPDIGIDFPLVKPGPRRDAWAKTAGSLSVMGPWRLYGQSKLGNILTSNYFAKLHPHSVVSASFDPGPIRSDIYRHTTAWVRVTSKLVTYPTSFGAITSLWTAAVPSPSEVNGKYITFFGKFAEPSNNAQDVELEGKVVEYVKEQLKGF